jgi:hypothetical protein
MAYRRTLFSGNGTYVAPATAKSIVLAFIMNDAQQIKIPVAAITMNILAVMLSMELHITTGASNRIAMRGLRIARAALIVEDRGNIWT